MRQRGNIAVFGVPTVIALWFVYGFALKYLTGEPGQFGIFTPRHQWLYAHVLAGTVTLLLGPAQLWLGLNRQTRIFHRILGLLYVAGVGVSSTAALYLAVHTDYGWVFGLGFASMAAAAITTTALGTIAICLRRVEQHREWMIRSYVVTFGFVTFRLLEGTLEMAKVGTMVERMTAASWLSWTIPLLSVELIIQGRKIFASPVGAVQIQEAVAYDLMAEPSALDLQDSESSYPHA